MEARTLTTPRPTEISVDVQRAVVVVVKAEGAELAAARAEIARLRAEQEVLARALEQMYRIALSP